MASSTMEKQDHQQNQAAQAAAAAAAGAAALRCPRCDSANTKFCYYNNYSLSQPRHFCKACKRYWTRGGTLRNVPVGGGCRKNKRLKRPSINNPPPIPTSSALENPSHRRQFQIIDQINNNNPLFYNKQQPYDQLSSFALAAAANNNSSSSPPPASNGGFGYPASNLFGGNNNNPGEAGEAILSPTMATLLASTLNNKFSSSSSGVVKRPADSSSVDHHNHFQAMAAFDGLQMSSGVLKNEQQQQGQEWNFNAFTSNGHNYSGGQHQVAAAEQIGSDPQSVYWNALWHDPGNIGPSVTSLI